MAISTGLSVNCRRSLAFTPTLDTVVTRDGQEAIIPWQQEPEDTIFRRIAHDARWNQFHFHGNYFWRDILARRTTLPGSRSKGLRSPSSRTK
jgi:hypothetical protein